MKFNRLRAIFEALKRLTDRAILSYALLILQLHSAMLALDEQANARSLAVLAEVHPQITDLLGQLPVSNAEVVSRNGLIAALRILLEGEFHNAVDEVHWHISPVAEANYPKIPTLCSEVIYYAARESLRNAARHARSEKIERLILNLRLDWIDGLEFAIEDNGRGIQEAQPEISGGHGLALHSAMLAVIGGALLVESTPQSCTRVRLILPISSIQMLQDETQPGEN